MRLWLAASLVVLLISPAAFAQRGGGHGGGGGHMSGGFGGGGGFHSSPGFSGGFAGGRGMNFAAPRANFSPNFSAPPRIAAPTRSFSTYPGAGSRPGYPAVRSAYGQQRMPQMNGRRPSPGKGPWGPGKSPWGRPPGRYVYRRPYFYVRSTYLTAPLLSYWPYFGNGDYNDWGQDNYSDQSAAYGQSSDVDQSGDYASGQQEQLESEPPPPPAYSSPAAVPTSEPTVTLVFKDGHSQQMRNYAATRTTLLLLDNASSGRMQQIPLDEIDLAATERINREAGVDFSLPAAN